MVLINNLTIDEINAALLHLQRARTEVVGGTKGSTVQNITISNKGGGSTVDYAPTITALSNRIDKNTDDIESVEDEIDKIQETLEQLSDNGISSMTFDPVTRQLQINAQDGEVYSCDITSENITLNFDATTNKLTLEMGEQYQEVTLPYINANEKGSANGVATLDSSGRVPYSQLPESAMEFLGNWNASTNTPHLQDGTGTNGDFYVCNVGGTVTFGTGNTQTFVPNDRVIYNGTSSQWVKLPAGQVSSVNGMSGDVTLTASNIEYSTGVTIKQQIDANAPVQSDWNVTDTTSMAYIKNKPTIPASPVQSDWNVTDTTSLAYIKNKPTIPSTPTLVCCAKCLYATCENDVSINWRTGNANYYTTASYQTAGNEALVFATKCAATSFMFVNGEDSVTNHANTRWSELTPGLQIKCNKVIINKLIGSNVTPSYELEVNGTVKAALYCGGVADAGNGTATTFAYSKQGLQSNPSWLAGWNGYELRAVSPSVVCVNSATWVKGDTMRPTNSNLYPKSTNGSLTHFLATSSMTTGKPMADGHIIHMSWDNAGGWGAQLYIPDDLTGTNIPQYRGENGGTWSAWHNFITDENIGSQHVACADSVAQTDAVKNLKSSSGKYYVALTGGSNCGPVVVPDGTELTYCIDTGTLVAKRFKDIYCNTMITNFGQIMNCTGGDLYRLGCTGIFRFKSELWCTKGCDLYCAIYNAMSCAFDDGWSYVCRYVVGTTGSRCSCINGCYRRMDISCVALQNGQLYIWGGEGNINVSCGQTSCVITGYLDFMFLGKWSGF